MNINFTTTNNVTNNTMHKLITILTSIFIFASLASFAGCDTETGDTTATTTPDSAATTTPSDDSGLIKPPPVDAGDEETDIGEKSAISFELPEGWEVKGTTAHLYEQPEDSAAPNVELEVYARLGTEEDAKKKISDLATAQSELNATFSKMEIGGRTVFVEEENSDLYYGEAIWINNIEFEKEGRVYSLWMTDRIQNRQAAIEMLIETIKFNE